MTEPGRDVAAENRKLREELDRARAHLVDSERDARLLRAQLTTMQRSVAVQFASRLQGLARRATPAGTRRQRWLHMIGMSALELLDSGRRGSSGTGRTVHKHRIAGVRLDPDEIVRREYTRWLATHTPGVRRLEAMRTGVSGLAITPMISVLMPVLDPDPAWLRQSTGSIVAQVYPHWELILADDGSARADVRDIIDQLATTDARVRAVRHEATGGIARASNSALSLSRGEFVCMVDHDDVLRSHALYSLVTHLQTNPDADIVYTDEDTLLESGEHASPRFKPDYSPDLLLSYNYITHLVMIRRSLVVELGGFREDFDGSQDHDLLLRATERAGNVGHVADVLYGWRSVEGSTARSSDSKPLAREAGLRAVEDALRRRDCDATVGFGPEPGTYTRRYAIGGTPSVLVVVCACAHHPLKAECIESVQAVTSYPNFTITVVHDAGLDPRVARDLESRQVRMIREQGPCSHSAWVNRAVRDQLADHILVLGGGVIIRAPDWMQALVELSQRPEVGAVGARLVDRQGRVRHTGMTLGRGDLATSVDMGWPVIREVAAVSRACLMTRRAVFEAIGGLNEQLEESLYDVDYCLRARAHGHRVLSTPHAELVDTDGGRMASTRVTDQDRSRFVATWADVDQLYDPYVNINVLQPNPLLLRLT